MRSVVVAMILAGCFRSSSPPAPAPSNKAIAQAPNPADDVLGFLPIDAEIVFGFDANELRKSALWRQFEPQIMSAIGTRGERARACGFDLATIERLTFAGKLLGGDRFDGVVVLRGLDGERLLVCLAKETKTDHQVTKDGDVFTYAESETGKVVMSPAGSSTLVLQIGAGANRDTIATVLASGAPLRHSPAFMRLFGRREPGAAVWVTIKGTSPVLAELSTVGLKPSAIDGTLSVSDRLSCVVRMTFASVDEATQLVGMVGALTSSVQSMFERFEVKQDGEVARFELVATEAQVRALIGFAGSSGFGP